MTIRKVEYQSAINTRPPPPPQATPTASGTSGTHIQFNKKFIYQATSFAVAGTIAAAVITPSFAESPQINKTPNRLAVVEQLGGFVVPPPPAAPPATANYVAVDPVITRWPPPPPIGVEQQQSIANAPPPIPILGVSNTEVIVSTSPNLSPDISGSCPQQPTAPAFTAALFVESPQLSNKPTFRAALQQDGSDFGPAGKIVSVTPQGWMFQSPILLAKPYNVSLQQSSALTPVQPVITVSSTTVATSSIVVRNRKVLYQSAANVNQIITTAAAQFTNWGWASESPQIRGKAFSSALQQDGSDFSPQGRVVSTTPQGWMFQSPILLAKPYNVSLQQVTAAPVYPYVAAAAIPLVASESPQVKIPALKAALQQYQAFAPQGSIFSITPQGWMLRTPDTLTKKSINISLQQVTAAAPFVPAVTATPAAFGTSADTPITINVTILYDALTGTPFPPPVALTPAAYNKSIEWEVYLKPFKAILQQEISYAPFAVPPPPATATPTASGSQGAHIQRNVKFIYQSTSFGPAGTLIIPTVTPSAFQAPESPQVRVKPYNVAQQQFASPFADRGTIFSVTPQGGWVSEEPLIPVVVNILYDSLTGVNFPTPIIYTFSESPQARVKPLNAAQQQFTSSFTPLGTITAAVFTNWGWASEGPIIPVVVNALYDLLTGVNFPSPIIYTFSESPALIGKHYNVALQQDITAAIQQVPTAVTPHGWQPVIWEPIVPPYKVTLQQFQAFGPAGQLTFVAVTPSAFQAPESPQVRVKPYNVAQQQFASPFAPQGTIFSVTPQGWYGQGTDPTRAITRLGASLAQFTSWPPQTPPVVQISWAGYSAPYDAYRPFSRISDQGGFVTPAFFQPVPFADSVFIVRSKPALAQDYRWYTAIPPARTPGPFGFSPSPDLLVKPNKVDQRPFEMYGPMGNVPTRFVAPGWMAVYPHPIVKGYPSFLQQFSAAPIRFVTPPNRIFHQPKLGATSVTVTFKGLKKDPTLSGTKTALNVKGKVIDP